jgi:hypothetical protein
MKLKELEEDFNIKLMQIFNRIVKKMDKKTDSRRS